ncbi:MAG: UDP-N-acetylenolpyruvoylglucosamine reductase [Pelagibacteraceae bacterium BACL5 MAG-120820-bin39]|jgi:UDP-N-acetylmuramate dehydrogenase|nr:MAG: UDP-N-acetylenolpyruvoylglucosamine reductase [Pelagibacteraceae bacterium BACL5 MAG-120820-bin39]
MKTLEIKNLTNEFKENLKINHDIKKKNWFNIGGKTKLFFKAENLKELSSFIKKINKKEKIFVLGAGSNTLFTDRIYDGVVIKLSKNFNNISQLSDEIIIAGSSVTDKALSEFAMENDLAGFEFLSCIPGTIGGGIKMNAGCFGTEFKDIILSVQAMNRSGQIITIPSSKIKFEYRINNLPKDLIFLSASFRGKKSNKNNIKSLMKKYKHQKEAAQPTKIKTSGSTFKNPIKQTDKKVWELIKDSVPLDTSFGDAVISDKHCNFFVNKGNASFEEMKNLIKFVSNKVYENTGILIETEIVIIE